jgi:hypothetical protein
MEWTFSYLGRVRKGNSKAGGLVGPNSLLELPELAPIYGDHVVTGAVTGDFQVTAGTGLTASVAPGYAIVRGVGVDNASSRILNLPAADATLHRVNTVVLELDRAAGNTEGRVTLKVVSGSLSAFPDAPTMTQNDTTWQWPLADVQVNAAASSVTAVNDRRNSILTSIERSGTQTPVLRSAPGATALTTTPTAIAALQHSITLDAGVWYDIIIWADIEVSSTTGSVTTICYIEGTTISGTSASLDSTTIETLSNAHSRSVLGSGTAVICGVLINEVAGNGFYYSGMTSVLAIPRS